MISFHSSFPANGPRKEKGSRCRVIGEADGGALLFLVNTLSRTIIEKVFVDGTTITVISFKGYMDLVSASVSADNELCHITERIPKDTSFLFSSFVCNVQTCVRSAPIESEEPITAFFVGNNRQNYQLIHIIGSKIAHLTVDIAKEEIQVHRLRGGLNFFSCLWWNYDQKTKLFSVIHRAEKSQVMSEFKFIKNKIKTYQIKAISINEEQIDVCFSPLALNHLPFYEFNKRRIFITHYKQKILVVQQFHPTSNNKIEFMVSLFPNNFNDYITVDVDNSDLPISYIHEGECAIVYSPNHFYCFINFSRGKPSTFVYNCLEDIGVSEMCQPIGISNYIIDMISGQLYEACIDLSSALPNLTSNGIDWNLISLLAQRSNDSRCVSSMFSVLQANWSRENAMSCISSFFEHCGKSLKNELIPKNFASNDPKSPAELKAIIKIPELLNKILPRIEDMEINYPPAGLLTRKQCFVIFFHLLLQKTSKNTEEAAMTSLTKMEKQNTTVSVLRSALDEWKRTNSPPATIWYCVLRILQFNTVSYLFPSIEKMQTDIDEAKTEETYDAALNLEYLLGNKQDTKETHKKSIGLTLESIDEANFCSVEL